MKFIFCLLLVASQVSFGQIILKDSSFNKIQLPYYKKNLLQMPEKNFLKISPAEKHEYNLLIQPSANFKLMQSDNMICIIPDISKSEKMQNANSLYLQSDDKMPNYIDPRTIKSKRVFLK